MISSTIRSRYSLAILSFLVVAQSALTAEAVVPSESILPNSTKGWFSVGKFAELDESFDQMQIGKMFDDASMEPFRKDVFRQIEDSSTDFSARLGFEVRDLEGIANGELSLALIAQKNRPAAVAVVIDTTGKTAEADALLVTVEQTLVGNGARKELVSSGTDQMTVFSGPGSKEAVYFKKDGMLCGVDSRSEAEAMLGRFAGNSTDNLSAVSAFQVTMERCAKEAGSLQPQIRWHVDPFDFVFAFRTLNTKPEMRDRDFAQILFDSGFDAIKGVGGYINLMVPPHMELVHRTSLYAPAVKGKENDPLRWTSSMRMLQLPNVENLIPEMWAPRMCANYGTALIDIQNAFDHVAPVFDAIAGYEAAFETTMEGYKEDPYGPRVSIRDEFIANLDKRATMVTDYVTPIGPYSERHIYAIKAKDYAALAKTLDKIMDNDPDAVKHQFENVTIWEIVEPDYDLESLDLDMSDLSALGAETEVEDEDSPPNSAICVAEGYLMAASDVNYIREVLTANALSERLINSNDHNFALEEMKKLAPGPRSAWSFARTDEAFRPSYELIRQGKMPESDTSVGRMLNSWLTTQEEEDEGRNRRQRIDGSKLPNFETIRRYFGPVGRVIRSDEDGWFISGALFHKNAG